MSCGIGSSIYSNVFPSLTLAGSALSPFHYYIVAFPRHPLAGGSFYNSGFAELFVPPADVLFSAYQISFLLHCHVADPFARRDLFSLKIGRLPSDLRHLSQGTSA
jgi:hypothetical protein